MAPEFGVSELPLTNDRIIESKEMESEDIEDGEILEDESNDGEAPCEPVKTGDHGEHHEESKNNFERFFNKEKRNHHHHRPRGHQESHKSFRRDRPPFPPALKKRKRSDDDAYRNDKFYGKKNKRGDDLEGENDEEMIFMLGGSLREVERKMKNTKKTATSNLPETHLDPMIFNEGENQDPRPYARRSPPSERRDKMKKERGGLVRGVGGGLLKRRGGRGGGPVVRKENQRESTTNDVCSFFAQGKCLRGGDCPYLHPYNQPRKLEICKFYLNDCCTKRDKCIYMHADFPCKYFHLPGLTCSVGTKCKFSHSKLDEVQRAVLKKYADVPMKEIDEMQRFYRETGNPTPSTRNKEKKDSRIPSLFDIKVAVPPEYRANEGQEGDGVTTPIPSPESMVYENDDSEEKLHKHHHKHSKVLAEHNDYKHDFCEEELEPSGLDVTSKHKKKSRKSDELSDSERSRKHSEKKKKKSKKEDKDSERAEKKKKKKDKRSKIENIVDAFTVGLNIHENAFEVSSDEKIEREPADGFAHLPKKQQELFLRIQQHQKEADTSQNANVDEEDEEDDSKADVNWYSSDEEETPEPVQETTSPLATLLRTIHTSSSSSSSGSNNVPCTEKKMDSIPTSVNLFSSTSSALADNESVPMVDASQLANIDLSDEVTKILTSIMKTETASTYSDTISNSLPSDMERSNDRLSLPASSSSVVRKPFPVSGMEKLPSVPPRKVSSEDLVSVFRTSPLFGINSSSSSDSKPKDIDLRQLPFKPIPVHDAANEIDASITSHPPMEYKLRPLPFIPRVNYAAMIDAARNCARDDPRFKRKALAVAAESVADQMTKPADPRFDLKAHTECAVRTDPRIRNDPRLAASAKNIPAMTNVPVIPPPMIVDPRMEKESVRPTDFRDPRLLSCNKFPQEGTFSSYQMAAVAAAAAAAAVSSLPQSVTMLAKEPPSLRKEDPRLRFRANQNA